MNSNKTVSKEQARVRVKQLRKELTREAVEAKSAVVITKLKSLDEFAAADNVMIYVSYNNEVDTKELIKDCLSMGKNVFVPKVYGELMRFHKITSFEQLKAGSFGILEPDGVYLEEWDYTDGLMIMPGLAFDFDFNRVGYGGGYYDRYLFVHNNIKTVALCFDFQLFDRIETEEYDVKPDILISETCILRK